MRKRNLHSATFALSLLMASCNFPSPLNPEIPPSTIESFHPTPTPLSPSITTTLPTNTPELITPDPVSTPEAIESFKCPDGESLVAIIVQPVILSGISERLSLFQASLCAEEYAVVQRLSDFRSPSEVRSYLSDLYVSTDQRLEGAILIGDIPYAYQWVTLESTNRDIPSLSEEVISFQYFADLDGSFDTSQDYVSPEGHAYSYDIHSGDIDWEIWIGVMPLYDGDVERTIEAINRYFDRNLAYRLGETDIPRAFIQVNEHFRAATQEEHERILSDMRSGSYAWTPFSSAVETRFFFESPTVNLTLDQGYQALSNGLGDFFVANTHGYWAASGKLDIPWVESHRVRTHFFWSDGCSVGNLDYPTNFLTAVLYSPTSSVLIAKGTTNNSGGLGTNDEGFFGHNIATALTEGDSFGKAILRHVNVPLIYPWSQSREFHLATPVFLGDLTLRLRQ